MCPDLYHTKVAAYGHMDGPEDLLGHLKFHAVFDECHQWIEYLDRVRLHLSGNHRFMSWRCVELPCYLALSELVQATVPLYSNPSLEYCLAIKSSVRYCCFFGDRSNAAPRPTWKGC